MRLKNHRIMKTKIRLLAAAISFFFLSGTLSAQFAVTSESYDRAEHERTGQAPVQVNQIYQVSELLVHADIHNQVATVNVTQSIRNVSGRQVEIELLFPLPAAGAVQHFILMVDGKEVPGKLLDRNEARTIYEGIVRRKQDPALMEYAGYGLYRTSVFPVPAGGTRTISLKYTLLCSQKGGNVQFIYPFGTQKFSNTRIGKIMFTADIAADKEIRNVFSPSHKIMLDRSMTKRVSVSWTELNALPTTDFKLYFTPSDQEMSVSLMSYMPVNEDAGSFLLLVNPDVKTQATQRVPKDIIIVLDKSGSMQGQKIEQARSAAQFILNNLNKEDRFIIIPYESVVSTYTNEMIAYSPEAVRDAVAFVGALEANGGTNIQDALTRALSFTSFNERPQYLLFLTDGQPTVGETSESGITSRCKAANKHNARIYTFGIGYDVNARLLDRVSNENGGAVTYIKPGENLEVAVSDFYRSIQTPVLTDITVEFSSGQVSEIYPIEIPDFFEGNQIEIAGRFMKPGKTKIILKGKSYGEPKRFEYDAVFAAKGENLEYAHIESIWATRKIGFLIDQIDLQGQNQELVNSLVELSKKYGIITPYTSFLAREDVNMFDTQVTVQETTRQLQKLEVVSGSSAVNQRANKAVMKESSKAQNAGAVEYKDEAGDNRLLETVKNVGGHAFYYKNNIWVDGALTESEVNSAKTVKQFSEEWFELSRQNSQEMNQLMTFDKEVVVQLNGQVYKIVE